MTNTINEGIIKMIMDTKTTTQGTVIKDSNGDVIAIACDPRIAHYISSLWNDNYSLNKNAHSASFLEAPTQQDIELLIHRLKQDTVHIKFRKVDGSLREMNCTLDMDDDESCYETDDITSKSLRVYDVDLGAWRSFRKERLIAWSL